MSEAISCGAGRHALERGERERLPPRRRDDDDIGVDPRMRATSIARHEGRELDAVAERLGGPTDLELEVRERRSRVESARADDAQPQVVAVEASEGVDDDAGSLLGQHPADERHLERPAVVAGRGALEGRGVDAVAHDHHAGMQRAGQVLLRLVGERLAHADDEPRMPEHPRRFRARVRAQEVVVRVEHGDMTAVIDERDRLRCVVAEHERRRPRPLVGERRPERAPDDPPRHAERREAAVDEPSGRHAFERPRRRLLVLDRPRTRVPVGVGAAGDEHRRFGSPGSPRAAQPVHDRGIALPVLGE